MQELERDAILEAGFVMDEKTFKEAVVLAYPDTPFQIDRSIARALKLVKPELSIIAEDKRSMVVHLPGADVNFLTNLVNRVKDTMEGCTAQELSYIYRFWIPGHIFPREHSEYFGNIVTTSQRRPDWEEKSQKFLYFSKMAAKRLWEDLSQSDDYFKADFDFLDAVEKLDVQPLSYEGYLAVLKEKIEEVLGDRSEMEGAVG